MRIRLKKGVALFGAIAGAAIATALIVYNVNHGNSVNVSDMENSGLFSEISEDLEDVLSGKDDHVVIADGQSVDTAASAGIIEGIPADDAKESDTDTVRGEGITDTSASNNDAQESGNTTGAAAVSNGSDVTQTQIYEGSADESTAVQTDETVRDEVQVYVESVPQTRTETVVDEKLVTVERPVTITEEVTEEVDVDPVYFYSQTGTAAAGEFTTTRREQEKLAAQQADMERIKAANGITSDEDWKVPDDDYGDILIFE